jgi:hypothetical protein
MNRAGGFGVNVFTFFGQATTSLMNVIVKKEYKDC